MSSFFSTVRAAHDGSNRRRGLAPGGEKSAHPGSCVTLAPMFALRRAARFLYDVSRGVAQTICEPGQVYPDIAAQFVRNLLTLGCAATLWEATTEPALADI